MCWVRLCWAGLGWAGLGLLAWLAGLLGTNANATTREGKNSFGFDKDMSI